MIAKSVKELIEILQTLPEDAEVYVPDYEVFASCGISIEVEDGKVVISANEVVG